MAAFFYNNKTCKQRCFKELQRSYSLKAKAREFNVQKSESMFREAMKWRKDFGVNTILETYKPLEVVQKYRTGGFLPGTDKHGCPIFIDPIGQIDSAGLLKSCKKQDLVKHVVWLTENIFKLCHENGLADAQVFLIADMKGFGLRHFDRPSTDLNLEISKLMEMRYPELLRKMIIVNAPRLFPVLWKILSPTLHENTKKKVSIFSNNFQEELFREVDREYIPVCYGGTLVDSKGDPECSDWICRGGTVPKHFYNQPKVTDAMKTIIVGRGSTVQLDFEVKLPNSVLRYTTISFTLELGRVLQYPDIGYEFCSDGFDIAYGVFRRTSDERQKAGDMDAILPSSRVNSHMVPEDGLVDCPDTGTYVVRFDNTYSWTRSKTVHYIIEILEPQLGDIEISTNTEKLDTE